MDKYLNLAHNNKYNLLEPAGKIIKKGGLVIFPTETVYGLGTNGLDEIAIKKIFTAKGRSSDNPLILHISDFSMLDKIAINISDIEYKLMKAFWPGPFTIILDRTKNVPNAVTGGLNTVGVRMPSNIIAKKLIEYSGVPIAAPSANISGKPSGTNILDIKEELYDKVDYIIDGGECEVGLESTVVRVSDGIPNILRPGKITPENIKKVVGNVHIDTHILEKVTKDEKVMSPGMKYKHYAPNTKCILFYSDINENMVNKINEISQKYKKPLIISCLENKNKYISKDIITIGSKNNLQEIAKNIFKVLRKADNYKSDIILIEGCKQEGIGFAIMNRLIRACEYDFIIV